jgi:hypothetical protein
MLFEIEDRIAKRKSERRVFPFGTPQKGTNPGEKLTHREWLDEVIVGPRLEAFDSIIDQRFGGKHQDWGGPAAAPKLAAERESIESRHHHIEQHEIRLVFERLSQTGSAIGGGHHAIAVGLQSLGKSGAHRKFVFDHQ